MYNWQLHTNLPGYMPYAICHHTFTYFLFPTLDKLNHVVTEMSQHSSPTLTTNQGIKPQKWPGAWHPNLCTKPYPMGPFVAPRNDSDSCRSATDRHNSDTVIQCDSVEIGRKDPQASAICVNVNVHIFCLIGETFASTPAKSASSLRSAVISRNFWSTLGARFETF